MQPPQPNQRRTTLALADGSLYDHENPDSLGTTAASDIDASHACGDGLGDSTPSAAESPAPAATPLSPAAASSPLAAILGEVKAAVDFKACRSSAAAKASAAPAATKGAPKHAAKSTAKAAMKRPAAAGSTGTHPTLTVLRSRSCVVARTGLPGGGQTRSIHFASDSDIEDTKATALTWLREKCEEMGVECPL
jgi:hypothetical protein